MLRGHSSSSESLCLLNMLNELQQNCAACTQFCTCHIMLVTCTLHTVNISPWSRTYQVIQHPPNRAVKYG